MKLLITVSLLFVLPALSLASDVSSHNETVTAAINHDDGGKLSKRHLHKLLDTLSEAGCHAVLSAAADSSPQLVFDPQPVSDVVKQRPGYRLIARAKTLDGALSVRGEIGRAHV